MLKMLKTLWANLLDNRSDMDKYLGSATDLQDLEHRQKMINRGQAPFQQYETYKRYL